MSELITKTVTEMSLKDALDLHYWPHGTNPALCTSLGTYEAMVVEWIHRWIIWKRKNPRRRGSIVTLKKGRYWVYKTLSEWYQEFPHIPPRTLRSVLERLRKLGAVATGVFNKFRANRTLWYTVNYRYRLKFARPFECKRFHSEDHLRSGTQMHLSSPDKSDLSSPDKSRQLYTTEDNLQSNGPPGRDPKDQGVTSRSVQIKKEYAEKMKNKLQERLSKKETTKVAGEFWQTLLTCYEVTSHVSLSRKEWGFMKNMVSYLGDVGIPVSEFFEYCVANWSDLRRQITWPDNPKKSRVGTSEPFFQELYYLKEEFVIRWERYKKAPEVKTISTLRITAVADIPTSVSPEERKRLTDEIEIIGYTEIITG